MNTKQHDETLAEAGEEGMGLSGSRLWAPAPKSPGFWQGLPLANQLLFAGGFGCLGLGVLLVVGPPVAQGAQTAIFPYTSAGKRQTCLSNLETLSRALALYAQDNGGALPAVEVQDVPNRARVTWVTQLRPYVEREGSSSESVWSCPTGSLSLTNETCAYGLNPILAGVRVPQGEEAAETLLLGDRGTRHDLSLLPPVPGWNTAGTASSSDVPTTNLTGATNLTGTTNLADATNLAGTTNLDFRHEDAAGGVFADGHAAPLSPSAVSSLSLWGGEATLDAGLRHIEARSAAAGALVKGLRAGDVAGAGILLKNPEALETTVRDLQALWMMNWQQGGEASAVASLASSDVEEIGWHLARAQGLDGHGAMGLALNAEIKRRAGEERKRIATVGWQTQRTSSGLSVEVPQGWTWGEINEGRYHTASARSPLPGLWVSLEKGDRTSYSAPIAVDWGASEKKLRAKYGDGYKRLRMEGATLLGRPAGLWEYELEKPGSPRLHKRYLGTADGWNSYVLSVTAPANCFPEWRGDFARIAASLSS